MPEPSSVFLPSNTAVITGGASGIGLALVAKCHASGMKVLATDRNRGLLGKVKSTVGDGVMTFEMDVSRADDWAKLKQVVADQLGGMRHCHI